MHIGEQKDKKKKENVLLSFDCAPASLGIM